MPTILEAIQHNNTVYVRAEDLTASLTWTMGGWQCVIHQYDGRIWREVEAKVFRWAWIFDQLSRDEAAEWIAEKFLSLARSMQQVKEP